MKLQSDHEYFISYLSTLQLIMCIQNLKACIAWQTLQGWGLFDRRMKVSNRVVQYICVLLISCLIEIRTPEIKWRSFQTFELSLEVFYICQTLIMESPNGFEWMWKSAYDKQCRNLNTSWHSYFLQKKQPFLQKSSHLGDQWGWKTSKRDFYNSLLPLSR